MRRGHIFFVWSGATFCGVTFLGVDTWLKYSDVIRASLESSRLNTTSVLMSCSFLQPHWRPVCTEQSHGKKKKVADEPTAPSSANQPDAGGVRSLASNPRPARCERRLWIWRLQARRPLSFFRAVHHRVQTRTAHRSIRLRPAVLP